MDDLLKPLKTVHVSSQDPRPESLIKALPPKEQPRKTYPSISSSGDILQVLKSQPSHEEVLDVILFLQRSAKSKSDFNIKRPGPEAAQILNVLVSRTIPDHWISLSDVPGSASDRKRKNSDASNAASSLVACLNSIAGIGALLAQIKTLLRADGKTAEGARSSPNSSIIKDLLSVLQRIFDTPNFLFYIRTDTATVVENQALRQIIWKEFISIVSGGKALSIASEAYLVCKDAFADTEDAVLSGGKAYASWLGRQVSEMIQKFRSADSNAWTDLSHLFQRSLSLGYSEWIIDEVFSGLLFHETEQWALLTAFINELPAHHQRVMLERLIKMSTQRFLTSEEHMHNNEPSREISGVAYLLRCLVLGNELLERCLADWFSSTSGGGVGQGIGIRRAAIAALSSNSEQLQHILERTVQNFGDKLFIKHSPILQQEVNTQTLLLSAGYVHRTIPSFVSSMSKSGIFLNAISNRLSASSTRSRFLGMMVGVAISRLTDPPDKRMTFDLNGMSSGDSEWYLGLTAIEDRTGLKQDLQFKPPLPRSSKTDPRSKLATKMSLHKSYKNPPIRTTGTTSKIISIEEISDGNDSEDDVMSYGKPDSDAEDSEDDPTLVRRNKPTAPVYIRDLLAGLRDSENYERYKLAINTAPSLIRRKISFGTEVTENIEDLALVLVGLQDKYDFERFQENQLQSMTVVLVAKPEQMGPWYVRMLFDGDLSIAQRTSVIATLGLGARELAGYRDEDSKVMGLPKLSESSFPSKTLPDRLHAIYSADGVSKLTKMLSERTIEPLALNAADQLTGPNALKVRTFSSRMEVEKKRKQREAQKSKTRNKDLHKILTKNFILPLTGCFAVALHSWTNAYNPFLNPHLLNTLLQTFTLLVHTLGSSSPSTGDITHELLPLLFSIRSLPTASEPTVLEALLSVFLALVDFNTGTSTNEERLVTDYAREVTELREWAGAIFERTPKGEEKVRMLAAGVMVKIGEVAERWERRLMGAGVGF